MHTFRKQPHLQMWPHQQLKSTHERVTEEEREREKSIKMKLSTKNTLTRDSIYFEIFWDTKGKGLEFSFMSQVDTVI